MSAEYRRAKRKRAEETIEVIDTMTDQVVGRIGNISETGMMMLATVHLMDDALFQLRFNLPDGSARGRAIEIGSHQLWSDAANVQTVATPSATAVTSPVNVMVS